MSIRDDDSGQFILLMSIVVAIGLVIVLVFLNQSMMAGHSSSVSIMDFPKNDIRDIRAVTLDEASSIGSRSNAQINGSPLVYLNDNDAFNHMFDVQFANYTTQVRDLYAEQGTIVDITNTNAVRQVPLGNNSTGYIYPGDNTTISFYYYNGETSYNDTTVLYFR